MKPNTSLILVLSTAPQACDLRRTAVSCNDKVVPVSEYRTMEIGPVLKKNLQGSNQYYHFLRTCFLLLHQCIHLLESFVLMLLQIMTEGQTKLLSSQNNQHKFNK
jgi:hypothetical protein